MPVKILFNVKKGELSGKTFVYDGKESVIVGRQDDCNIALPEVTVSRYHCLIDIAPPSVMVRDFGSLNGTYLNGEKIGQRASGMSVEAARDVLGSEFALKPGDRLGIGKDCEISFEVILPQYCADCFCEIDDTGHVNPENMAICADCHEKRREEQKAREAAAKAEKERAEAQKRALELALKAKAAADAKAKAEAEKAQREAEKKAAELKQKEQEENQRKNALAEARKAEKVRKDEEQKQRMDQRCEVCGGSASASDRPCLCEECRKDPRKVLRFLMEQAGKGRGDAREIAGYRNIRMLGKGGMGQVWLVEEEKTGERMALKIMLAQVQADEHQKAMFLREAYGAGQLNHPNIVRHFKCGQSGDAYFILMEACDNSVDTLITNSGGKLSLDLATHITLQVLDGLIYAHKEPVFVRLKNGDTVTANGIVHRDFKPGNIFLTGSGKNLRAKIGDFGLAKAFETSGLSNHTRTGAAAGTPVFMPKQQVLKFKYAKPDVDVWAAAASYYYMLTGAFTKAFVPEKDLFLQAISLPAVPIRVRNPNIPQKLAAVIDKALEEKPKIGVQSAAELKHMIERAI